MLQAFRIALCSLGVAAVLQPLALSGAAVAAPAHADASNIDWTLTPAQIKTSCAVEIARAKRSIAALAQKPAPWTFANTTLALEDIDADLNDRTIAQTFLNQVSVDAKIRAAALDCSNDESAFNTDLTANPALYARLAVAAKNARNPADRALSTLWLQQFSRSGAGLPSAPRAEFVRLSKELNDAELKFGQNIANDKTTIAITKVQAAGLPADFVTGLKATDDGYIVGVNDSTVVPFLQNASDESARKAYYIAFQNIGSPANVALLERAIAIRSRLAKLMGFPTWAAYQLDVRVDRSPAHIARFLDDLDTQLLPQARKDVAEFAALKVKTTGDPSATIESWDTIYYRNQLDKEKYSVDPQEVKQYFPAGHTVDAVLAIYQHLLGVTFEKVASPNVWQPDVIEYGVSDTASGRYLGSFFLDLYARDGKPGGAFNNPIRPVRRVGNGFRSPLSAIVVSDWPARSGDKPVLLTHDDVTTFFHEFGHNMAALLTTVPYESLTSFQQDFVEAPSQMLENFTWDPSVLKKISSNVDSGEPLPANLIAKIVAARCATDRLCNALTAVGQLELSILDLDYHTEGPKVDTTAVFQRVSRETTPLPATPGVHPQASFSHLMGGYDAGYYTYLWSLVYAQDMFTAFKTGGIDNPAVGKRYRETILEPAREKDPATEVRAFLGRPMNSSAFYDGFKDAS